MAVNRSGMPRLTEGGARVKGGLMGTGVASSGPGKGGSSKTFKQLKAEYHNGRKGYKSGGAVTADKKACGGKAGMKDGRQKAEFGGVMGDPYLGGGMGKTNRPGATRAAAKRLGAASKNLNPQTQAVLQNRLAKMTATGTTQPALKKFNSLLARKSERGADRKAELVAGRDERRAAKIAEKQQTGGPGRRDPNDKMGPGDNTNRRTPQEPVTPFPPGRGGKTGVAPLPGGKINGPTRPGVTPRVVKPTPVAQPGVPGGVGVSKPPGGGMGVTPLPAGETLDRTQQKRGGKVKPKSAKDRKSDRLPIKGR